MNRRELITFLGGAAAAWPLAARAQQPAMPTIAYLGPLSAAATAGRLRAFRQGLTETGYIEGENVAIGYRFAEGQNDRLPAIAIELARRQVSVLVTGATPAAFAAKAATTTIPIVFILSEDPVRLGLVASIPRPGSNATGINFVSGELGAKRLDHSRPRPDCVAGHVRFELRNVVANYPFESSRGFPRSEPNSGHGDHSRLSCSAGDTQLGAGFCRDLQQALCTDVGHDSASPRRHELAAISFDQKMIRPRQSQQHHCSVCAGLSAQRERVW
jgi:hypothetical protein